MRKILLVFSHVVLVLCLHLFVLKITYMLFCLCACLASVVLQQCIPTLPTWARPDAVQCTQLWPVHHTWPSHVGQRERLHHCDLIHWGWPGQSLCDPAGRGRDRSGPLCVSCFHHCVSDLNASVLFFLSAEDTFFFISFTYRRITCLEWEWEMKAGLFPSVHIGWMEGIEV